MASRVTTGTVITGFRVQSLIGAGAMGSVYLAEDTRTGEQVALKVLASQLAEDERFQQRFVRESELVAALDHPHVVPVVSSGEVDGMLFLAMARIEGSDLRAVLQREGRLEPERAVRLVAQIAGALDAAHAAGLVHRDVKPANILIGNGPGGEHAYICDFGLARHASSVSSLTGDRGFVGTIDYVPPEQIAGGTIDARTDVYSLGCVLFECLAGARPFERETDLSVIFAHLNEPPPPISERRPELPAAFDGVFARALAKTPDDRYPTCGALAAAVNAALRGQAPGTRKAGRRRLLIGAAALVAAAGVASGTYIATRGGSSHAPPAVIASPPKISQTAIDGAKLGLSAAAYKKRFGGYREAVVAGPNYPTLAFQQPELAVYFSAKNRPAIIITTWNPHYVTGKGIGPCSTLAAMKKAYGRQVTPASVGTDPNNPSIHSSYVVGDNLIFVTQDHRTISAVALYHGTPGHTGSGSTRAFANYIAANETACIGG
jgi:hypothetical protein